MKILAGYGLRENRLGENSGPTQIKVFIEYGWFSPIVGGVKCESITLPSGATVKTLIEHLGEKYGAEAKKYLEMYPFVISRELIAGIDKPTKKLKDGEWVKILAPIEGG
ncbi:MoaD/ThiS family protein [Candidatus Hecatella orcuttiae]|jgi:molybdopterin converting factor small subunit|uniref:MoaD/ThiS family protein n=1 Tax=Candidatus Hecatella orcuttiae TaxID=1935119 RepID=UPI002867C4CD|nr:MoaD/ThiS family protein [Candidatus Hecatella orcuttiae]